MKIIELWTENIKKIKVIEIKPTENTIVITGKNGAGKSSVLDSVWFLLTGKDSLKETSKPIREGEDHASVRADIGDYIVTRTWTSNENSYIKVENKKGAKYSSPQALLDSLATTLNFDPLEFARMEKKKQKEVLLEILGLSAEVEKLDNEYQAIFDERTFIGRNYKAAKAQFDGMVKPRETLPEKEIDISALNKELSEAIENNQAIREAEYDIKEMEGKITEIENKILELTTQKEQLFCKIKNLKETLTKTKTIPVQDLQDKIDNAVELNNEIRNADKYYDKKAETGQLEKDYKDRTAELNGIIAKKSALINTVKMPIEGLSFGDEEVLFNSIPLAQLAISEQIKITLFIAIARDPKLKDIFIRNGSLLDSSNFEFIKEVAKEKGFNIWIEKVDESGNIGIFIEDGEIKVNNYEKPVEDKK